MKIIIPVSEHDEPQKNSFINVLSFLGNQGDHQLLVVARPKDKTYASDLFNKIKLLFPENNNLYIFDDNGPEGWPLGPNFYWKKTIDYLIQTNNKDPWFWMELDCLPLKRNWCDLLEEEYKKTRKPFVGCIEDSTIITSKGILLKVGEHLAGTAIYPANIDRWCSNWKYVDTVSKAFDVLCSWEITKKSFHTNLILHNFRTNNYKIKDKIIICSDDQ